MARLLHTVRGSLQSVEITSTTSVRWLVPFLRLTHEIELHFI